MKRWIAGDLVIEPTSLIWMTAGREEERCSCGPLTGSLASVDLLMIL